VVAIVSDTHDRRKDGPGWRLYQNAREGGLTLAVPVLVVAELAGRHLLDRPTRRAVLMVLADVAGLVYRAVRRTASTHRHANEQGHPFLSSVEALTNEEARGGQADSRRHPRDDQFVCPARQSMVEYADN
jgi:hypothetical protein